MKSMDNVLKFLTQLGLTFYESKVFLSLVDHGDMTVLQISKESKYNRTGVYRIVEKLKELGLVEEITHANKKLIRPASIHKIELIVKDHESKAMMLKNLLPEISLIFEQTKAVSQPGTRVEFYKGVEGVKQILMNALKAKGEIKSFSFKEINDIVGVDFESKWKLEFYLKKLNMREIVSDSYMYSKKKVEVDNNKDNKALEVKYISPGVLNINHTLLLYSDVIATIYWVDNEAYGTEIYNEKLTDLQKQFFEMVWKSE